VKRGNSNEHGKMNDTLRAKGARLAKLITSAPTEAREKFHQRQQAAVDAEHQAFKKATTSEIATCVATR
jgi:septal ring factor EnvC (AmiA/AmiB activator)